MTAVKASNESNRPYQHWRLSRDIDNVAWLNLDRAGASTNVLSNEVLSELQDIVQQLERQRPAGLVLMSGKRDQFIAGADINEFEQITDLESGRKHLTRVHELFNRIENLHIPKAVAVEGYCLGGGLELALCFDWFIARNDEHTRLGFPEIKLGIYPGFGGSARSPQRIGGQQAMQLMLTGTMLRPGAARAMGLVDQLVGEHETLRWAARRAVLAGKRHKPPGLLARASNTAPARRLLANIMRKKTAAKARPEHYPAPWKLIEAWEISGHDQDHMLKAEIRNVPELLIGETSRNLRRVFRLSEQLKAEGKKSAFRTRRAHVVGAGVMGGDIAAWCVLQGLEVTLQDRELKYIEPALKRAGKLFRKKLRTDARVGAAMSRLRADVAGDGIARADVVIEAIFENLEAKRELYRKIEPALQSRALLATNTSALPLDQLAAVLKRPERLIGLHFFNPVAKMPLIEVVYDEQQTSAGLIDDAASFVRQIGKYPIPVKSSPGFLVNRVLAPYLAGAIEMYREGTPKEAIDKAALVFGMPMGPIELADTVGLDVGLSVIKTVGIDPDGSRAKYMQAFVDQGKLGKKSGEGFYVWEKGKPERDREAGAGYDLEQLGLQLIQPYLDECEACSRDGIVANDDLIDAGMIFGTGFAPFRGGPLHYLRHRKAPDLSISARKIADNETPGKTGAGDQAAPETASPAAREQRDADTGAATAPEPPAGRGKRAAQKTGAGRAKKSKRKTAAQKTGAGKTRAKKSAAKKKTAKTPKPSSTGSDKTGEQA